MAIERNVYFKHMYLTLKCKHRENRYKTKAIWERKK